MNSRDFFFLLSSGPRGVKWLHFDGVIQEGNPLMFTCSKCRKTTGNYPYIPGEKLHEDGCMNKLMNDLGM